MEPQVSAITLATFTIATDSQMTTSSTAYIHRLTANGTTERIPASLLATMLLLLLGRSIARQSQVSANRRRLINPAFLVGTGGRAETKTD